jgi:lysophospholipase L1-like esterase
MTTVPYVDAVDVLAPASVGAMILFGDSITDGYVTAGAAGGEDQSAIDANQRYPDFLARRLLAQPGGPRLSAVNAGISGNRLLADGTTALAGPSAPDRLRPDVIGVSGVADVIVLEGINDINGGVSAQQVEDGLAGIVARLHAAHVRVLLGTIIPAGTGLLNLGSLTYLDSPINMVRVAVNAWIRSGASGADGVVDFDAALRGAAQPNVLDPAYDSGDHVHPNSQGYRQMADAVDLSRLGVSACAASTTPRATKLRVRAHVAAKALRVSGNLTAAAAIDCTGSGVTLRALHAGRTIFKQHLRLTPACRFAATRRISARGRIEVRVSFGGTPALLASHAGSVFPRAA